ncbi:cofactor assembly of complex C subunit B [Longirhabdus pacifica]|uniref:cofactor assembly of complex C subunit B n=1 Tax=Longirhabdus pacifica TaxID=2305227 RepID=UPI0013E898FD|nr:cofactor assembly of complex C subunit B [Longirhabdus pacifica]
MEKLKADIMSHLDSLRNLTATDFCSLALMDDQNIIRWRYVSGNRNDRYKRIALRLGRGIAGQVIRSGRPMYLDSFKMKAGDDPKEYPILLAENLKSVLAAPVTINHKVQGVLMIGYRYPATYTDQQLLLVEDVAEQLGSMLQAREKERGNVIYLYPFNGSEH